MRIVLLFFAAALGNESQPQALEGQEIAWVAATDLASYPTPPADAGLVELLIAGRMPCRVTDQDLP